MTCDISEEEKASYIASHPLVPVKGKNDKEEEEDEVQILLA